MLTLFHCLLHSRVTAVACKRPRSVCQKCWWQVTKHAYTLDQMKSEFADYSCPATVWEPIRTMISHTTCQRTLVHSHLSSVSHCGLILAQRVTRANLHLKKTKKCIQAGHTPLKLSQIVACGGKKSPPPRHNLYIWSL